MTRLLVVAAIALTLVTSSTGTANADYRKGLQLYYAGDFAGALAEWRAGADRGDTGSQYAIGTLYERGEGVAKDDALALEWIQRAAEGGFAMAQYHLATIYRIGRVVARDYAEAARWYRAAAEKDLKESQSDLGLMYENGFGVEKDLLEAVRWYKIAAAQGYPAALAHIARLRVSNPEVVAEADRREAERLAEQRSKSKPSPRPATKGTGATKALPKSAEAGGPKAAPPADEAPASKAPDQRNRIAATWTRWSDKVAALQPESVSSGRSGGAELLSIAIPADWALASTNTLAGADFGDDETRPERQFRDQIRGGAGVHAGARCRTQPGHGGSQAGGRRDREPGPRHDGLDRMLEIAPRPCSSGLAGAKRGDHFGAQGRLPA